MKPVACWMCGSCKNQAWGCAHGLWVEESKGSLQERWDFWNRMFVIESSFNDECPMFEPQEP